jgi:hypothetical protein
MSILREYDKILIKKIICLDKQFISEQYRTQQIVYNDSLDKMYIQTPYIYNRYSPSSFEGNLENKIHLDLLLEVSSSDNIDENSKQIIDFYKLIEKIQRNLKIRIRKKNLAKLKFISSLKEKKQLFKRDEDIKVYNFRTKIHSMNGKPYLKIFNSNRQTIKDQTLRPNCFIRYILHLESIWFFNDTYGFNWFIAQAEIKLPDILKQYSFSNDEPVEEEVEEQYYDKYIKMLKMRIPEQAIKNKMLIDGLDPNILDTIISNNKKKRSLPIPPPPPQTLNFTNITLNKVSDNDKIKSEVPKTDFRIPSKEQLLEHMKNLKKVEKCV